MSNLHMNKLNDEDRALLTGPFTIEEIKKVVFGLKHNSAPSPDGFGILFILICEIYSRIFMKVCLILKDLTLG
jgi:hypothetical protein